jgi:ribosome-associated protein
MGWLEAGACAFFCWRLTRVRQNINETHLVLAIVQSSLPAATSYLVPDYRHITAISQIRYLRCMASWVDRGLDRECVFTATRSSGAGGQHVNKTATKAELAFHIGSSTLLTDAEKARLQDKLSHRITDSGYLKVSCDVSRSQATNRAGAYKKLTRMLDYALAPDKVRKATQPSLSSVMKRKESKKQLSARKEARRTNHHDWQ